MLIAALPSHAQKKKKRSGVFDASEAVGAEGEEGAAAELTSVVHEEREGVVTVVEEAGSVGEEEGSRTAEISTPSPLPPPTPPPLPPTPLEEPTFHADPAIHTLSIDERAAPPLLTESPTTRGGGSADGGRGGREVPTAFTVASPERQPPATTVVPLADLGGRSSPSPSECTVADDRACVVCFDRPKTHAFIPCGHRCVCKPCSERVMASAPRDTCPVCRQECIMAVEIYN